MPSKFAIGAAFTKFLLPLAKNKKIVLNLFFICQSIVIILHLGLIGRVITNFIVLKFKI